MPRLTDIAKEVGNAISTRERVVPLFRRLKELESYMDPSFGESKGNVNSSYSRLCTIQVKILYVLTLISEPTDIAAKLLYFPRSSS